MSTRTVTELHCDRCHAEVMADDIASIRWATVRAKQDDADELRVIGAFDGSPGDLCASCADGLFAWWAGPREAAMSPPNRAVRSIQRFTLIERKAAFALLDAALREQVVESVAIIAEQPTSLLEGQVLPDAFSSVRDRASATLAAIVQLFEQGDFTDPGGELSPAAAATTDAPMPASIDVRATSGRSQGARAAAPPGDRP